MSLLVKGGIRKLSELEIDANKDWQAKGIMNIKELASGMVKGDIPIKGVSVLEKLIPGAVGNVLTSAGPGHLPSWQPGAMLEFWIPAAIEISHAEQKVTVDETISKNTPISSSVIKSYLDDPSNYIKRLTPAMGLIDAESNITINEIIGKIPTVTRDCEAILLVDGAVADDGGVQTDETSPAKDATADDMTLLPAAPQVNDAYYLGFSYKAPRWWVNVTTAGLGNWALAHEYYDGVGWSAMVDLIDGTSEWTLAGKNRISHTPQGDWSLTTIQGMNLYWIRARVSAFNNITTQPLGGQAWAGLVI